MARAHDQSASHNEVAAIEEEHAGMPRVIIGAGSPEAAQQLGGCLSVGPSGIAVHAATDQLDFARTILSGGQHTGAVVLLVDAGAGSGDDMLWRCYLSGLLGVDHIVLAIDNLDDSGPARFERLVDQYRNTLADGAGSKLIAVPVSVRTGANIAGAGGPDWYQGKSLNTTLVDIVSDQQIKSADKAPAEFTNKADQFAAHLIWFDSDAMLPERPYEIRMASGTATVQITQLRHRVDVVTLEQMAAATLHRGEIGHCNFAIDAELAFDTFAENHFGGSFTLHDKHTDTLVGIGVIEFALRRASNLSWHDMKVSKQARALNNQQKPCVLWFTGLSGAGKSTVADRLEVKLHEMGRRTYLLDGDNVRHGLNKDLGFTDRDRVENIRRVAEVSKLMVDAGLIVIVSFISPFRSERQMARDLMEDGEFLEVFVDTPLEVCEQRDPKGLYKKARSGELKNFTGIDSDYEPPLAADLTLTTVTQDVETIVGNVIAELQQRGCL